jgi:PTS system nitrogen regulatory IIA component
MTGQFTFSPDAVAIIEADSKQAVLEALAARFAAAYGLEEGEVLERLEERERLGSTGFGRAVAIPHARVSGLAQPVVALLRIQEPVDFAAADGLPVDLVIGLLSPESAGVNHLHALAAISRMVRDERMREALATAPHVEALSGLLTNVTDRDAA